MGIVHKFGATNGQRLAFGLALAIACAALTGLPGKAKAEGGFFAPIQNFFSNPPEIRMPKPDWHLPNLSITPFWTPDLVAGREAYAKGNYEVARDIFRASAQNGNVVAEWYLGHMYRLGHGVPVDPAIAYSYFNRVAETYNPAETDPFRLRITVDAKIRAADALRLGIPSAKLKANPQAAARTYLEMANSYGHPRALYALGVMNIEGEGMKPNPQQGLKWLYAAVRKQSPEAAAYMGELCDSGEVVPRDATRALTWYLIAANTATREDTPQIFQRLGEMKFAATPDMRLEAEAKARLWAEQNPGPAVK